MFKIFPFDQADFDTVKVKEDCSWNFNHWIALTWVTSWSSVYADKKSMK